MQIDKILKKPVNASKNSEVTNEGFVSSESSSSKKKTLLEYKLENLVISEDSNLSEPSVHTLTKETLKKNILDFTTDNQDSLNLPLFGGNDIVLENSRTVQEIMLPIYKSASPSDPIKIGVLEIDKPLFKKDPYNQIAKKYRQNLNDLVPSLDISEQIMNRLNELRKISDINKANEYIKKWQQCDNLFSQDFEASMFNFITNITRKIWRFFSLESRYWDLEHSESHISSAMHFEIFFDLFFDKNYSVEAQKELYANKDRRNYTKTIDDNMARGLIPDITITNLRQGIEFLIIEHGKFISLNDKKKELEDTLKSCTLLHDMIRRAHNNLMLRNIEDFKKFQVFGAVTSALEVKFYMLNIVAKELYIFQEIANCVLPSRLQEYNPDVLCKTIITFIKLRILIDKNFNNYDMMFDRQFNLSNPPPSDDTKLTFDFEKSPQKKKLSKPFGNTRKT